MAIPGVRVLDEIFAGLPTNSQQRIAIAELKSQIAILEKENADLKGQLEILRPKHDLPVEAGKILLEFFERDTGIEVTHFTRKLGLKRSVVKYYFELLEKKKLLRESVIGLAGAPEYWYITDEGRAFVVEKGLA